MTNTLALPSHFSLASIEAYMATVNRLPRLSADEEQALARKFRDHDDLEAAKELVMANLRFVIHVARGYSGYGLALPDLVQEGNIGLMKAVKRFDPDLGVRLVSFAVHWIRAEIHEFVIRNWRIVKVATTKAQRKLFFNLRKTKKRLGWLNHSEAQQVADDLGVKVETVYEMERRLDNADVAFDAPADDSSAASSQPSPAGFLRQENSDPATLLEDSEKGDYQQRQLTKALGDLEPRSRDILVSRWLNEEKATLHDLAARYDVSAERIRQIEKSAMKKIKSSLDY